MPCYEVNLMNVQFKVENVELLLSSLKNSGQSVYRVGEDLVYIGSYTKINLREGTITGTDMKFINSIKRGYSKEVVKVAAKRNKWILQTKGESVFVAVKY